MQKGNRKPVAEDSTIQELGEVRAYFDTLAERFHIPEKPITRRTPEQWTYYFASVLGDCPGDAMRQKTAELIGYCRDLCEEIIITELLEISKLERTVGKSLLPLRESRPSTN